MEEEDQPAFAAFAKNDESEDESWLQIGKSFGSNENPNPTPERTNSDSESSDCFIFAENMKKRKKSKKDKKEKKEKKKKKDKKKKARRDSPDRTSFSTFGNQISASNEYSIDYFGDQKASSFGGMYRGDIIPFLRCKCLVGGTKDSARRVLDDLEYLFGRGPKAKNKEYVPEDRYYEDVGEPDEEIYKARNTEFDLYLRKNPTDVSKWLSFVHFQQTIIDAAIAGKHKRKIILFEKQKSILLSALSSNPKEPRLHLALINIATSIQSPEIEINIEELWQNALRACPNNSLLWLKYYDWMAKQLEDNTDDVLEHVIGLIRMFKGSESMVLEVLTEWAWGEKFAGRSEKAVAMFQTNVLQMFAQRIDIPSLNATAVITESFWTTTPQVRVGSPEFHLTWNIRQSIQKQQFEQHFHGHTIQELPTVEVDALTIHIDKHFLNLPVPPEEELFLQDRESVLVEWAEFETRTERTAFENLSAESVVPFEEVDSFLLKTSDPSPQLELIYRFLEFLGSSLDRLASSDQYAKRLFVWRTQKSFANKRFTAYLACQCLLIYPNDPILFYALADATGSNKISKQVLMNRSEDWRFWGVYATNLWRRGKEENSSKVIFEACNTFGKNKISLLAHLAHFEILKGRDGIPFALEAFVKMVDGKVTNVSLQALSTLKKVRAQIPTLSIDDAAPGIGGMCSSFFAAVWTCAALTIFTGGSVGDAVNLVQEFIPVSKKPQPCEVERNVELVWMMLLDVVILFEQDFAPREIISFCKTALSYHACSCNYYFLDVMSAMQNGFERRRTLLHLSKDSPMIAFESLLMEKEFQPIHSITRMCEKLLTTPNNDPAGTAIRQATWRIYITALRQHNQKGKILHRAAKRAVKDCATSKTLWLMNVAVSLFDNDEEKMDLVQNILEAPIHLRTDPLAAIVLAEDQ